MRVSDAQVHIWDSVHSTYSERGKYAMRDLLVDMDSAGVDRAVLVPTRIHREPAIDNSYCFEAARLHRSRFCVMARLDPGDLNAEQYLEEIMAEPGMKGLRLHLGKEGWDEEAWVWPKAIDLGIAVAVFAGRGKLGLLRSILLAHPELPVLLDHVALPALGQDAFGDFEIVLSLERFKNVTIKCSALPRYSEEGYPFSDVQPYLKRLYETFGPERLAWGSDYSTHRMKCSYCNAVDLVREAAEFVTEVDRQWILDKTLSSVLSWE